MSTRALRFLCLMALFLGVQLAALAHGVSHLPDGDAPDEPPCVQCLAFAPLGAALLKNVPTVLPPVSALPLVAPLPTAFSVSFSPLYHSRAPPLRG